MGDHSQEEQALMKLQHEWAEARIKVTVHTRGGLRLKTAQLSGRTAAS
jgi:hypothetical protein